MTITKKTTILFNKDDLDDMTSYTNNKNLLRALGFKEIDYTLTIEFEKEEESSKL